VNQLLSAPLRHSRLCWFRFFYRFLFFFRCHFCFAGPFPSPRGPDRFPPLFFLSPTATCASRQTHHLATPGSSWNITGFFPNSFWFPPCTLCAFLFFYIAPHSSPFSCRSSPVLRSRSMLCKQRSMDVFGIVPFLLYFFCRVRAFSEAPLTRFNLSPSVF